ncbi:MAG TPA: hypothetical protein VMH86_10785 [Rhizomicrobium sp.]|nr:hypothetical protein [Rhizomicrobium sp.]
MDQNDRPETETAQDRLRSARDLQKDVAELARLAKLAHANDDGAALPRQPAGEPGAEPQIQAPAPPEKPVQRPDRDYTREEIARVVSDVIDNHPALKANAPAPQIDRPRVTVASRMKELTPPPDAAATLERQIASCAVLIETMSDWVMRDGTDNDACFSYMERISTLLLASAKVGRTVGGLRGQVSETLHTMVMKEARAATRKAGREGGGRS